MDGNADAYSGGYFSSAFCLYYTVYTFFYSEIDMIYGIFGKTGCGKTYFMVDYLATNYFEKIKDQDGKEQYVLKKKCRIISNIDNLDLEHIRFDDLVSYYFHLWLRAECSKKKIAYWGAGYGGLDTLSDRFEEAPDSHELSDDARKEWDIHYPERFEIFFSESNQLAICGRHGKIVSRSTKVFVYQKNWVFQENRVS